MEQARATATAVPPVALERFESAGKSLEAGDPTKALVQIDEAIAAAPSVSRFHVRRSMALDRGGKLEDALAAARRAVEVDFRKVGARAAAARILSKKGAFADALATIDAAIALKGNNFRFHLQRSRYLFRLKRRQAAIAAARRAVELAPGDAAASDHLSKLLARGGAQKGGFPERRAQQSSAPQVPNQEHVTTLDV